MDKQQVKLQKRAEYSDKVQQMRLKSRSARFHQVARIVR